MEEQDVTPPEDTSWSEQQMEDEYEEQILSYVENEGERHRSLRGVRFDTNNSTRENWIDQRPKKIVCNSYYAKDTISPQCQLNLFQLDQAVANYEVLTEGERSKVPYNSYENAKA